MYYVQFVASLIRDFTSLHHTEPSADVGEFLAYVRARQHAECPFWFHLCKDRSSEVPKSEWLHERFLPPDFRVDELARVLKCTHILERHAPPLDCVCTELANKLYVDGEYTLEAYRRRPEMFDMFWLSSFTCVALAELVEYEGAPLTVSLSEALRVQKGLTDEDVVRVVNPRGPTTSCVQAGISLTSVMAEEEGEGGSPTDLRVLECRWNLSEANPVETFLFVQGTIDTLAIPFKLEKDLSTGTLWVRVFMLEMTVSVGSTDEFHDKLVMNPWSHFMKGRRYCWRSLMSVDYPDVQIMHSHAYTHSSDAQTAIGPGIEVNVRDAWSIQEVRHFIERPKNSLLCTDFSSGAVWCMDMPDYPEDIADKSQIKLRAPETPYFTRDFLQSLIAATRERHVAHMIVRSDAHLVTTGTTSGHVTITYGPTYDICLVYVTTCYKVGVHYRIGHVVMVSRDAERTRAFFKRHVCVDRPWIQEDVFLALATRVCRLCASSSMLLPPIPVGRVLFREEYAPVVLQKGTWKLAGCGCGHCAKHRLEPLRATV